MWLTEPRVVTATEVLMIAETYSISSNMTYVNTIIVIILHNNISFWTNVNPLWLVDTV